MQQMAYFRHIFVKFETMTSPQRLDPDALAVLAAIIRTGSFDGASKSIGVTQSAISQRIKQLEEGVGSILIVRGRPCVPTETGLILFSHYEQLELLQAETLARMRGERQSEGVARVRVSANYDSLATWFPQVIKQASDQLNLRLEVVSDDQEFTEHLLRSGEVLAALSTSADEIPGCSRTALGQMTYTAVASPAFCDRYLAGGLTPAALAEAPSITFDPKDSLPARWMQTQFGEAPALSAHQVPSYEGHLACALEDVGWAIMPILTVRPLIEAGRLVDLSPKAHVPVPLSWYSTRNSSVLLAALSDIVRDQAARLLARA